MKKHTIGRRIQISQSVDPNTMLLEIREEYRMQVGVLISRGEAETLCNSLRTLLGDAPVELLPSPKLAIFPTPKQEPMKVGIRAAHLIRE